MAVLVRLLLLAALTVVVAGCGGSASSTTAPTPTATNPVASAPDATQPPPDATQPGTGPITTEANGVTVSTTPKPAATTPSSATGGKGGSEPVRTPAAFTIKGGKLVPPGITVPPFIAIRVTVVSADGAAHKVVLQVPPSARTLAVPPHGRAALRVAGLRAGSYGITLDGRVAGGIVVGGDGGP